VGPVAVAAGLGKFVITAAGGLGIALLLGFEMVDGIFISVALMFSSPVVVVKLLDIKGDVDSLYGRIVVGIFLVQGLNTCLTTMSFCSAAVKPSSPCWRRYCFPDMRYW